MTSAAVIPVRVAHTPDTTVEVPLRALVGPTASGKTEASMVVAPALGAEIVSVDSMVLYRGMDAGTAKPTPAERAAVPHHLLDVAEPWETFSVARYQRLAWDAIADIGGRGRVPLLVGGSGLYLRAAVDRLDFPGTSPATRSLLEAEAHAVGTSALFARLSELDPQAASRIEPSNARRVIRALEVAAVTARPFSSFASAWGRYDPRRMIAAGVDLPKSVLHRRIERRTERIMPGLLREAAELEAAGVGGLLTARQAIGYAEALAVLAGTMSEDEAVAVTVRRTKSLARHQLAWFRRDGRIRWFSAGEDGALGIAEKLASFLRSHPAGAEA
jgi:tRNA dimethylallyltransferase